MSNRIPDKPAGRYGVDALVVAIMLSLSALALLSGTIVNIAQFAPAWISLVMGIWTIVLGYSAITFWYATLHGKFLVWARLLDSLHLKGDETCLDLGCGRGAVLIATALRVPHGHATGIDLWRSRDQSGNSAEATRKNTELNGVADRITLETGDMTALPYEDASFDLVTASISIHNIPDAEGRGRAVSEALRVLRPGGRLVIVDLGRTKEYIEVLRNAGVPFTATPAGWQMQWGMLPTTIIQAQKSTRS